MLDFILLCELICYFITHDLINVNCEFILLYLDLYGLIYILLLMMNEFTVIY